MISRKRNFLPIGAREQNSVVQSSINLRKRRTEPKLVFPVRWEILPFSFSSFGTELSALKGRQLVKEILDTLKGFRGLSLHSEIAGLKMRRGFGEPDGACVRPPRGEAP